MATGSRSRAADGTEALGRPPACRCQPRFNFRDDRPCAVRPQPVLRFRAARRGPLRRLDLPIVPIIRGMVRGGIRENRLRTAMVRIGGPLDFISRPMAAILFGLIVLVIALHLRTVWREWQRA